MKLALDLVLPYLIYLQLMEEIPCITKRRTWHHVGYLAQQKGLPLFEYEFQMKEEGLRSPSFETVFQSVLSKKEEVVSQVATVELAENAQEKVRQIKERVRLMNLNSTSESIDWLTTVQWMKNEYPKRKAEDIWKTIERRIYYLEEKQLDIFKKTWEILIYIQ